MIMMNHTNSKHDRLNIEVVRLYFIVTSIIWERLLALGAMSFVAEFHQRRWAEQTFSTSNFLQLLRRC